MKALLKHSIYLLLVWKVDVSPPAFTCAFSTYLIIGTDFEKISQTIKKLLNLKDTNDMKFHSSSLYYHNRIHLYLHYSEDSQHHCIRYLNDTVPCNFSLKLKKKNYIKSIKKFFPQKIHCKLWCYKNACYCKCIFAFHILAQLFCCNLNYQYK